MMSPIVLAMKEVIFTFEHSGQPIIDQLSFELHEGEVVALVGPSGSGKSTLFRLLSGLLEPQQGEIFWRGQALRSDALLGKTSYIPQQPQLMDWRTVAENAMIAMELRGIPKKEASKMLEEPLTQFGLAEVADAFPHQLSGGMKQRVSLLRGVMTGAEVMLMDEPFSALDAITRFQMHKWLLQKWEQQQPTVVLITHDLDEAILLADRILLVQETPIRTLMNVPVELPRPRQMQDVFLPEYLQLKKQLLSGLQTVTEGVVTP